MWLIRNFIFFVLLFFSFHCKAEVSKIVRQQYVQQIYNSFLIQSIGETRLAYRTFKNGFQEAQKAGEDQKKLDAINSLFLWYRKYGWGLGLMTKPCNCAGESTRLNHYQFSDSQINYDSSPEYLSEWGKSPQQAKNIRSFMFGVAEITAGIFALSIGTPLGYTIAGATLATGINRCYDSFNEAYAEYEERMLEFKNIEQKILKTNTQ